MTKTLKAMEIEGVGGLTITLKERTISQIYKYLRTYMMHNELYRFEYVKGSQFVSKCNGCTYANFKNNTNFITTLCIYDNPELG